MNTFKTLKTCRFLTKKQNRSLKNVSLLVLTILIPILKITAVYHDDDCLIISIKNGARS